MKRTQINGKLFYSQGLEELTLLTFPYYQKIQCNSYQNTRDILQRNKKDNTKICMEPQKILNSQRNLEQKQTNEQNTVLLEGDGRMGTISSTDTRVDISNWNGLRSATAQ